MLLSLSLLTALALPALASPAMGDDLTKVDTLLNQQTQLSTNVFWSTSSSDYRTENLITYSPNTAVTPIVTYGSALTSRNTVSKTAKELEAQGYRVVAGLNGDFYNVTDGIPVGLVITQGQLRCDDHDLRAIGFRADGTSVFGWPSIAVNVSTQLANGSDFSLRAAGFNRSRTDAGLFLYTYDFNASRTNGTSLPGVDVLCTIQEGSFGVGETTRLVVEQVIEAVNATSVQPNQVVLSANLKADEALLGSLRGMTPGEIVEVSISASSAAWHDVEYAIGALYPLVEYGAVSPGLEPGANPRTAIGQRADGSVIFYTIDGRKPGHSIGATMTQIAQRLIELGCVTAYCMDGGGSTTIAVTKPLETSASVINVPSDGAERSVSNHIFLVASSQPTGELGSFYVTADNAYVLAGSRVNISASALDTHFLPMNEGYDLSASAGFLEGNVLTTPPEGGDITVTAYNGGSQGSTVVHAISMPDSLSIRNAANQAITTLTALPGTTVQLHGAVTYNRTTLKADPDVFFWNLEGDIGTIDENGLFTASELGTGRITVQAGDRSASINVTVADPHLTVLEDFEGQTTILRGGGSNVNFSLNSARDFVHTGRASGRMEYDLSEGSAQWNATAAPATLSGIFTGLNLWVYGDGSGNTLSLRYSTNGGEIKSMPITTLDFTGWKQVSLNGLSTPMTIQGLSFSGSGRGTIYLDHFVATYDGIVDSEAPEVTAVLNSESHTVTGMVHDAVDGLLPASSVTITLNGSPAGSYDAATGAFTVTLPGESQETSRVTVTAKDISGNIGRCSVDIPAASDAGHKFTDMADHWTADYADFLYSAGITTGYEDGTFRPDQNITRAQFAVMLFRYLKLDEAKYAAVELPFADLGAIPSYALPAVRALYSEGVITGSSKDGKLYFNPGSSLTRAQAAAMIGRTQEKGYPLAANTFADASSIPGYAQDYISSMVGQGVISGYSDGTFRPKNNITRGQMAKILYTLM